MTMESEDTKKKAEEASDKSAEKGAEEKEATKEEATKEEAKDEDLSQKISLLEKERDEWKEKAESLKDLYLRQKAEMDNYRKRLEREGEERVQREKADFFVELLNIIDNFEYFLAAAGRSKPESKPGQEDTPDSSRSKEPSKEFTAFLKGVTMIHQGFLRLLAKEGITPLDASPGTRFDPRYHEAVDAEELEEKQGVIIEEIRKGYLFKDRLLRPARVKVAK